MYHCHYKNEYVHSLKTQLAFDYDLLTVHSLIINNTIH